VSAAARHSGPGLALISVPGQHAFTEAMDALDAGCDVMIFSDNVPLEQEVLLKQRASESGLLVMGPDCGTAVVGGVGLGFAHTVQPGPVGIVAASGTGAQHVMCLLDTAGIGITACLGVGGRDLAAAVGGRSTRTALDLLDADPATELIIVISKPAPAEVSDDLRAYAATLSTPVHFAVIGQGQPDLSAATAEVIGALGLVAPTWPTWAPPGPLPSARSGSLRGLFVGGTLCDEAMVIASQLLGPIGSNIPLHPESLIDPRAVVAGHSMIDFGDDALTVGRPHPMIDPSLRLRQLARDGADDQTAVILLDVVLGHGSHPDPASELAAAIRQCLCPVVVTLVGARDDPQSLAGQADALRGAGAHVFASNAEATRFACSLVGNPATEENPATEVNPATAENPAPHEVSA
jgi:FdrA protein